MNSHLCKYITICMSRSPIFVTLRNKSCCVSDINNIFFKMSGVTRVASFISRFVHKCCHMSYSIIIPCIIPADYLARRAFLNRECSLFNKMALFAKVNTAKYHYQSCSLLHVLYWASQYSHPWPGYLDNRTHKISGSIVPVNNPNNGINFGHD